MLNFHGWTMSAADQMDLSDMRALAESEKWYTFISARELSLKNNFFGSTHWNVGSWTTGSTSDDIEFIDKLIDHMSVNYNIDLEKEFTHVVILMAGFSVMS